ncbi:MAG TPA: hypothetical protein GX513_12000, partial [Firmicutes bacterium]|nr:hypothetical protein [Bacillota bacterium]
MGVWKDKFSGLTYEYDDAWQEAVLTFLAQRCIRRLSRIECRDKVKVLADELADFWASEYYDLVFPLRFSHADEDQIVAGGTIQLKYSPG